MDDLNLWLVGGGLFIGLLFGIVVQRTHFSPDCSGGSASEAFTCRWSTDGDWFHLCWWLQYWCWADRHVDWLNQSTYSRPAAGGKH